ncbi:MAG: FtsX-like permease family protein [Thermoanaerobaculia bacterium]|nr:FtsX-like permease family protein [Thermoanaerobaculia bacterium]
MNGLLRLAARNLGRNRRRTALLGTTLFLAGLCLHLALAVADGLTRSITRDLVTLETGAVAVSPGGPAGPAPSDPAAAAALDQTVRARLEGLASDGVRRRLEFDAVAMSLGGISQQLRFVALEPDTEPALAATLRPRAGRFLVTTDAAGLVLSQAVAGRLQLEVGDTVTVLATTWGAEINALDLELVGIFEDVAPWIDYNAYLTRAPATELFGAEFANRTLLDVADLAAAPALAAEVNRRLAGLPVTVTDFQAGAGFLLGIVTALRWTFASFAVLLYAVAGLGLALLLALSVRERRRELSTLLALGFPPRRIVLLVLAEAGLVAVVATAAALLATLAVHVSFGSTGIALEGLAKNAFGTGRLSTALAPYQVAAIAAAGIGTSLAGALGPAWNAVRAKAQDPGGTPW